MEVISQIEHPVTSLPMYTFHPCNFEKLLKTNIDSNNITNSTLLLTSLIFSYLDLISEDEYKTIAKTSSPPPQKLE